MVDDPDLVQSTYGEQDLVQVGVPGDGIRVKPVGPPPSPSRPVSSSVGRPGVRLWLLARVTQGGKALHFLGRFKWTVQAGVDVHPAGHGSRIPEAGKGRVEILHEVVPSVPFPDNFCAIWKDRLQLKDAIRPQPFLAHLLRISTVGNGLLPGLSLPRNHKDVSAGQWAYIVVLEQVFVGQVKFPKKFTLPGK